MLSVSYEIARDERWVFLQMRSVQRRKQHLLLYHIQERGILLVVLHYDHHPVLLSMLLYFELKSERYQLGRL